MNKRKRFGAGLVLVGMLVALMPIVALPAFGTDEATVPLNSDHVGAEAATFENQEDVCADIGADQDGWHFIAPANANFVSLDVTFQDAGLISLGAGDFGPPDDSHAYVGTGVGDVLLSGSAVIEGWNSRNAPTKFNLSHTCPGEEEPIPTGFNIASTCETLNVRIGEGVSLYLKQGLEGAERGPFTASQAFTDVEPGVYYWRIVVEEGYEYEGNTQGRLLVEACDEEVTPVAPTVTQSQECEVEGTIEIPVTEGVIYLLNGEGDDLSGTTLDGPLSGIILAVADEGYVLEASAATRFPFEITAADDCPEEVTAVAPLVVQSDECEVAGSLTIPETGGVIYLIDGEKVEAGVYEGPLDVTVTAEAEEGHVLTNPEFSVDVDIAAAEDCEEVVVDTDFICVINADGSASINEVADGTEGSSETAEEATKNCPEPITPPQLLTPPSTLPFTGPQTDMGVLTGAALLLASAGGLMLLATRKEEETI